MTPTPSSRPSDGRGPLRLIVALTPLAGSLAFPIVVPLLMVRVSLSAGMLALAWLIVSASAVRSMHRPPTSPRG